MADYYAVLSRTLAGFGEPKPQMREKLYDRARSTIRRQLESRTPALEPEKFQKEMDSLEEAIQAIERDFRENDGVEADETPPPPPPPPSAQEASSAAPAGDGVSPEAVAPEEAEDLTTPPPPRQSQDGSPSDMPVFDRRQATADPSPSKPVELPVFEPEVTPVRSEPEHDATVAKAAGSAALPKVSDPAADAINDWAEEFLHDRERKDATPGPDEVKDAGERGAQADKSAEELPAFDAKPDETLTIPPAPDSAADAAASRGAGRWVLVGLLVVILLGAGATYAFWDEREELLSSVGLAGLLGEDGVKPTPVKTITIKPDPVPEEQADPEPEAAAPEPEEPKSEDRLVADPVEPATEQPDPIAAEAVDEPQGTEGAETDEQPAGDDGQTISAQVEPPVTTIEPANAGDVPAIAQSAILYEEGSTASENRSDNGRVIWSRVDEPTGSGEGTDPAIRARVEVPDRNLVMLMTIKRNLDRALPASHLIELVFAVPDDFSGGAIGNINRFVLKESEQGRGDALVGVPARIADGIFLIALNNLEQAKATNEGLLRQRSWIDIPLQYRTGRRALVTMEKGVPGEQIFQDVFAAWAKKES